MFSLNKSRLYEVSLIFLVLLFISLSGYIFFKFLFNFSTIGVYQNKYKIYLLKDSNTIDFLEKNNYSVQDYIKRFNLLKKYLSRKYEIKEIDEQDIVSLDKNSILIAFDIFNMSSFGVKSIYNFLSKGGKLLFNYHFAYYVDGKYIGAKIVENITNLKYKFEVKQKDNPFIVPNLLSVLSTNALTAKKYDYILYDDMPIFYSKTIPDAVMSNWSVTTPVIVNSKYLSLNEDGVVWHGNYHRGSWIYFSFPSYSLTDLNLEFFDYFIDNSIAFLSNVITLVKYPYLSYNKVIFISEDTEYKYKNLSKFSELVKEYEINSTAFCVAKLAQYYTETTLNASKNRYLEIGSHSYSHRKILGTDEDNMKKEIIGSKIILDKLTDRNIVGFRPPREEIDKKMVRLLVEGGYKYVMEKYKSYLYPQEENKWLITLPRHGTDDYEYIINLDWDKEKIFAQIYREAKFLTSLNILYTLSTHTHLMLYGSNYQILEKFFKLVKKEGFTPLKGKDIAEIASLYKNIELKFQKTSKNIILLVINKNEKSIKNFIFRIYYNNIDRIKNITPEIIGFKFRILENNIKEKYIDIQINKLTANSKVAFFIGYR